MPGIIPSQHIAARSEAENIIEGSDFENCLSPASYELRAGTYKDPQTGTNNEIPADGVAVNPQTFALIGTVEKINLPNDLAGTLYLKSSLGRLGITPWSQGFVDPGFSGNLTIVLHNPYNGVLLIKNLHPLCHIVFHELVEEAESGYSGPYQGSSGPSTPQEGVPISIGFGASNIISSAVLSGAVSGLASGLITGGE